VTLSVVVMAHPRREAMVTELVESLDRPAQVVWDEHNDRHDTGIRAMCAYDPAATHHLVIQDDAVACRDLLAGTEQALEHVPADAPVSLYVGRVRPFRRSVERAVEAAGDGVSWLTMEGVYWGPAIVVPTATIDDLAAWYRHSTIQNYDRRVSRWFEKHGTACWYSWPSLVDHRGDDSLVTGHNQRRTAHRFAGTDVSALSVDWSGEVVPIGDTARLDRSRQRLAQQAGRVAR
jgi:hypothetical protein